VFQSNSSVNLYRDMHKHFIAIFVAMFFLFSAYGQQTSSINFGEADYATVMEAAKTQQRNVLFYFTHPYCAPCKIMDRTVFNQPDIVQLVDQTLIPVKVDCVDEKPSAKYMQEQYKVKTFPSLLIVDPSGNIIKRSAGFMDQQEMKKFLATQRSDNGKINSKGLNK